ncbi:hypothetical protein CDL15_Pgr025710 [Punica granatum]|uniref:Uncharacterized protein n=1 Tax=Punica granatum TaxID=22663 RepID=A0A218WCD5_PUNGR|nr:hypothetical protein CDL15_Pgr025710 [Punica granatum]PKI64899.1 hypothetical protein CRG98_014695 [Punica granatum]
MTNEMTPKVRLVKCPKCRKLLPEPAGAPIYSCGGCGAILRAKPKTGDAQMKRPHYYSSPENKDSRDLNREVAAPSPSPDLQSEEDKDLSSSIQTVSVDSNTEGHEESDRICSSTELSTPLQEPKSDESAKVCSSTDLAPHDNQELLPNLTPSNNANVGHENSECVVVQSEGEMKSDGSGKGFETVSTSIPVDSESAIKAHSSINGDLKILEKPASGEYLDSLPTRSKTIAGVVPDDEMGYQAYSMHVVDSKHVYDEASTAVSKDSLSKEWSIQQKPPISRDPMKICRTTSSKSIPLASCMDKLTSEGLGTVRRGHPTRYRTQSDGVELPLHEWGHQVSSAGGEGPASQLIRNPLYSSTSYPGERSENFLPQDKEELLRIVTELENQLKGMHNAEEEKSIGSNFYNYQRFSHQFDHPYLHHNFHDPYEPTSSYLSSPQPHVYTTTHSWDCETKSDDQMYGFLGLKNLREKTHLPRRHFRPIAGASPLITCYSCFELLQLPEDFLVSRRKRCHWLRCGACSVVLKFSLQNGIHIAPYPPELDNHDDSNRKNQEEMRPSDGCGVTISKSCSSEGEPTLLAPTLPLQDKADDDPRDYVSSEDLKAGSKEASSKNRSSALHQLMGYSSVTQMLS